jgi:ubiquitin C-terminal hydrolase
MRGLNNCGNTCYFNTAIQCLAHCPALSNHLLHNKYTGDCEITREYSKVVRQLFAKSVVGPVDPSPLLGVFRTRFSSFANTGQHDAQEVVLCLIDVFEKSLGKEFIKNIFNGEETTETVYPGGKSSHPSEFTTLLFPLTEGGRVSLGDLLAAKDRHQALQGYEDETGRKHAVAATRTIVTRWPAIISFTFGMYGPKSIVEIPKTFSNKNLFAVVLHYGMMMGGHYAMAVKRFDKWYIKDDESVTELSEVPANGHFYMAWYR